MSTDNLKDEIPRITNTKAEKIKDPKRVEQGKKLAAISKAAKEKKAREKFEMDTQHEDTDSWHINYGYVVGVAGVVVGIRSFCLSRRQDEIKQQPMKSVKPVVTVKTIESFD